MKRIYAAALLALVSACESAENKAGSTDTVIANSPQHQSALANQKADTTVSKKSIDSDTSQKARSLNLKVVAGKKTDFAGVRAEPELRMTESSVIQSQANGRVRRKGSKLILTLSNGKSVVFADDTYELRHDENEETDKTYSYLGNLPGLPYWMVLEQLYEAQSIYLVNQRTGVKTAIEGELALSPNRHYLLAYYAGMVYEDDAHELRLFAINQQFIQQVWQLSPRNWAPAQAHWLNNQTIAVKQMHPDSTIGPVAFGLPTYIRLLMPK